jgi:signal transduction histidine kinase
MSAVDAAVGLFRRSAARRIQTVRFPHESENAVIGAGLSGIATSWNAEKKQLEAEWGQRLEIAERARADAQASSRRKDEFLAILGHELRNPLSAIRNSIVTAQLDPRRCERALEMAWRQTEQLGRLADDILDVSLVEQGRVRLKVRCIPLIEIVESAVETTRFFVEERGHTLSVWAPAEPVYVDGDPARLEQIVVNLVRNAAKYTERAGRIDLFVERDSTEAVIRVRDTGMGISADVLPRIFDLFFQADHTLEHEPGGFGIGLSVVRSLVASHDGRIEARSAGSGTGAEFIVHLPATRMPAGSSSDCPRVF